MTFNCTVTLSIKTLEEILRRASRLRRVEIEDNQGSRQEPLCVITLAQKLIGMDVKIHDMHRSLDQNVLHLNVSVRETPNHSKCRTHQLENQFILYYSSVHLNVLHKIIFFLSSENTSYFVKTVSSPSVSN